LIVDGVLSEGTRVTAPLATLGGRVMSRFANQPVAGASVTLDSTDEMTVTNADGRFRLERLLPGPYTLRAVDSLTIPTVRFDSERRMLTDSSRMQTITLTGTKHVNAAVATDAPTEVIIPHRVLRPDCRFDGERDRRFIVIGSVENSDRQRLSNVPLALTWADTTRERAVDEVGPFETYTTMSTRMDVVTDSVGSFVACGIPAERLIVARAVQAPESVAVGTARVSARPDDVSREMGNPELRGLRLVVRPPD
jgi:hypothetical protein